MQDRSVTLGFHPSAKCPLLMCHMTCIFMPRVTLSFVRLSRNMCNSDLLGIRRNSTLYLDFTRRTQRYVPRRHPRSREIPRFATRVYHFTLFRVSQSVIPHRHICTMVSLYWVLTVFLSLFHLVSIQIQSKFLWKIDFDQPAFRIPYPLEHRFLQ